MRALSNAALCLLVCVSAARAVPPRVTTPRQPELQKGLSSGQAAFQVPCYGCLGGVDDDALFFEFEALPASRPCGGSSLRLNGVDLVAPGLSASTNSSGTLPVLHDARLEDIEVDWEVNCLSSAGTAPADDSTVVLTVTISKLDGLVPRSLSGFTASFKQYPNSQILRLEPNPVLPAPQSPADEWRDPPSHIRFNQPSTAAAVKPPSRVYDLLQELAILKTQQKELGELIKATQAELAHELVAHGQTFQFELGDCDSLGCAFEVITGRVTSAFKGFYHSLTAQHWEQATLGGPDPVTSPESDMHYGSPHPHQSLVPHVRPPPPAYVRPNADSDFGSYGSYEKLPDEEEPRPQQFRHDNGRRRNPFVAVLYFVLVAFGLVALASFIRRRCASLRTRTERAANREERRNRRAYRRAARRAAWKNWWRSGWGRRKDQERRLDYEEKRTLIQEQELRLEASMQDEIQSLRHAHGVVDELVRAEEGRGTLVRPVIIRGRMPGMASIAGVMMGQGLYGPAHLGGSSTLSETDDGSTVPTPPASATFSRPMSRSNSLPSYRTHPPNQSAPSSRFGDSDIDTRSIFSDPPAYETDPEDSDDEAHHGSGAADVVTDGFTRYAPSEYATSSLSPTDLASIFTPDSSVPNLSPRESAETARTFM